MEFFQNAKAIKLKSHLDKYLVADDDQKTVRQSRNGSSRKSIWLLELQDSIIKLKSCHGKYLTASDTPFLLGMTGKKVLQTIPAASKSKSTAEIEWEPVRDGFQLKLVSRSGGKCLRANGGTPPWRNSITHDNPNSSVSTKGWVLWDVEVVDVPVETDSLVSRLSSISSFSSVLSDDDAYSVEPASPMSVMSSFSPTRVSSRKTGMDLFHNAKAVRLRSHHDKYLIAEEDEESISQDKNGSVKTARWTVEIVSDSPNIIRLKSCYNKYLTASNQPFLLGMTGRKALQTQPLRVDSSVEWEPIREGAQVKLKTRYGQFLRANGGLPPWRNSVTHDIPHRTATQDWILWDVDILEIQVLHSPAAKSPHPPLVAHPDSFASDSSSTPSSVSIKSSTFSRHESADSLASSPPKVEGRTIYYQVADEDGGVDDTMQGYPLTFKGNEVGELTRKLEEDTGIQNIIVCTRSPLNGKLYPLRLQLPPNNTTMRVIVVPSSSRVASDFA